MKKIKYLLILFIFIVLIGINKVNAYSINANSTVYVGNSVAVTVEAKGLIGRFDISSSNQGILAGSDTKWIEDGTITMYFTAKSVGKATITLNSVDVSDTSGNEFHGSRSITINVVKKSTKPSVDVNKKYSKNNYLSELEIDGYELTPKFDKDTLEYKVELEPGTEKIKINASLEDRTASVKGTGEVDITEGTNTLNVVVTAENGNQRTYKIIAECPEKDPINIKINDKKYTVVKRRELIGTKEGYKEEEVKIEDFDIPTLYNDVTKVTLVGVKDETGNISLVSYDSKTGEYSVYNEFKFDVMNLYIHPIKDSEYEPFDVKINGIETTGYKLENINDYYLVYATNTSTGYEGYYLYDMKENSVQRYDTTLLENLTKTKDKFFSVVLVLSCVCFLTMLFLLIEVNRDHKRENGE